MADRAKRHGPKRLRVAGALAAACLASCATYYEARFEPAPAEARIEAEEAPGVLGRALATVRGIRRPDSEHATARAEVALRVENVGREPLQVAPESFELVTADLQVFGAGIVRPSPVDALAPGDVRSLEVEFPFPAGVGYHDVDLSGLVLRWALNSGERRLVVSTRFERRRYDASPYFYGPVIFGGGPFWRSYYPRVGAFCPY